MQMRFDEIKVPEDKLNQVVAESMESVYKEHKKKRFHRRTSWCAAAVAGGVILGGCLIIPTSTVLPVLAKHSTFFQRIFEKVQGETMYSGDYAESAVPADGVISATSGDLKISFSETVCTSKSMAYSVRITSEKGFPEGAMKTTDENSDNGVKWIYLEGTQNTDFGVEVGEDELSASADGMPSITGHYEDDHTFVGVMKVSFNLYPFDGHEIPNEFIWNLNITGISYIDQTKNYMEKLSGGEWNFKFQVKQQNLNEKTIQVNQYSPSGWGIKDITVTPYEMVVNEDYDESKAQPGYDGADSIQEFWTDADGRILHDKIGIFQVDGYNMSKTIVYYMATPDDDSYMAMQDYVYMENHSDEEIKNYLEENCQSKLEIPLE